jgi:hypothetical protein
MLLSPHKIIKAAYSSQQLYRIKELSTLQDNIPVCCFIILSLHSLAYKKSVILLYNIYSICIFQLSNLINIALDILNFCYYSNILFLTPIFCQRII